PYGADNLLVERLLKMPEAEKAYRAHLAEIVATAMRPDLVHADIDRMAAMIRDAVAEESPEALKQFEASLATTMPAPSSSNAPPRPPEGPGPGRPPMMMGQTMPLKVFVTRRLESIQAQLDGKSEGVALKSG